MITFGRSFLNFAKSQFRNLFFQIFYFSGYKAAFTHTPHHTARRHKIACNIMKTHKKSRLRSHMDHAAPRCTGPHFRSVTFFNDTKQLFYMQTNHFVRRTELIKYFQHQIGGECLCPRKMQQVTFFGDTKEGMKMRILVYV